MSFDETRCTGVALEKCEQLVKLSKSLKKAESRCFMELMIWWWHSQVKTLQSTYIKNVTEVRSYSQVSKAAEALLWDKTQISSQLDRNILVYSLTVSNSQVCFSLSCSNLI